MTTRIYVGNVPYALTGEQLFNIFSQFGDVTDTHAVVDRETGHAKGFAFVEMADADAARIAIGQTNGMYLDNRILRVSKAQPRPERENSARRDFQHRQRRW